MSNVQEVMDYVTNTPHNTNPTILRQMLAGMGGSTDWNDITNKPFYTYEERISIIEKAECQNESNYGSSFHAWHNQSDKIDEFTIPDEKFLVTFNNKEYTSVGKRAYTFDMDGKPTLQEFIGNPKIVSDEDINQLPDTGEPFLIFQNVIYWTQEEGEHITFSVDKIVEKAKTLENKFIDLPNFKIELSLLGETEEGLEIGTNQTAKEIIEAYEKGNIFHAYMREPESERITVLPAIGYDYDPKNRTLIIVFQFFSSELFLLTVEVSCNLINNEVTITSYFSNIIELIKEQLNS